MKKRAGRFLFALLLAAAARADAPVRTKAFFWRVTRGSSTAYLLGSIHVGRPDFFPLDPRIEGAFASSALLAVEVNIDALPPAELLRLLAARAIYPPSDSVENHLSRGTADRLKPALARRGVSWERGRRLKPWVLSMMLQGGQPAAGGVSAAYGIDRYFMDKAKGRKPVIDLEYAEDQFDLLNEMPDAAQEAMLQEALSGRRGSSDDLGELLSVWRSGDDRRLEALLEPLKDDADAGPFYVKVFDRRNRKMAGQIEEILRAGQTTFVVVGAGHLVGERSVVRYLARTCRVVRL